MAILAARADELTEILSEGGPLWAPGLPTCTRHWVSALESRAFGIDQDIEEKKEDA
jgi:hypothetical protein